MDLRSQYQGRAKEKYLMELIEVQSCLQNPMTDVLQSLSKKLNKCIKMKSHLHMKVGKIQFFFLFCPEITIV